MVDNRSAGFFGIGGGLNFKSGDISGTAAKTADDRASQGTEYFAMEDVEGMQSSRDFFVDRSAQLNATLNSLAMMNLANILKSKSKKKNLYDNSEELSFDDDLYLDEDFSKKFYEDMDD